MKNIKTTSIEKLLSFYSVFSKRDYVLIVINADPDAIGSAMAIKRLLWRKVNKVTLAHVNAISRPDNIAMVRLLSVPLIHLNEVDLDKFNRFVIVDSQPDHHESFRSISFHVVIDHHPKQQHIQASFVDIRPDYGATSTILSEYLRAAKIKPSEELATAMFYGIKTDTSNFERHAIIEDVYAFQYLFHHANIHMVRKMDQADLRLDFLKYFKNAIQDMCIRNNRVYVCLGNVPNPDVCVLVADFFMRINPVTWSIVSGQSNHKLIIIFRNDGLKKHAGNLAKKCFGHLGSAGGHVSMARAEIPVDTVQSLVDLTEPKLINQWIIDQCNQMDIPSENLRKG
ncbi:MAG: DHH family phosphoesterase [Desulfobacterales bacterium]|nr:DHH family phosphoesterase [Desulfobacterales bacterium]